MKFNYSIILTFALVGIYSSLLTGKAISDTIVQQQLSTEVKCDEYFGLFFVDKSISGNNNIHSQINIINYFFNNNKKFSGNAFTSIVSQADKIIDNNYAVVGPSDFVNLRHQINNVVQESAGGENVSYYKLASGVRVNMNFNDHSKFPNNSAIIMFVDSHIAESSETKAILEEIRSSNPSVKTLALIYDDKYMNDAISLVGNEILVHKADDSSIDNLSKTIGWLIDNMCNSKLNNNAPTSNDGFFCNIAIGMETSSDILTSDLYIKERDVIANNLPTIIPDIERVAFAAFDREIHDIHYFGSFQSKDQFSNIVESVSSGSGSNIETIMEQFTYMTPPDCGKMSSFIFISENITGDIVKAQQYANILKNMGSLNFIILGTDLKPSDLAVFNPTSIYSFDFGNCDIDALLNYIQSALTCSTNGCIQPSPTPQPSCSGTTCNVAIAMDTSSDKLSPYYYQSEQSVLGENIVNIIPDISQVALVGYDANVEQFYGPGSIISKTMFSNYVNQYQQNPGSSLSGILKRLTQLPQNGDEKLSTFVFISELNTADSQNVQYYAQILKNRGSLNFVIIGIDVHPSDLYSFTNPQNIFKYEPGDCDIQDLLNFFTNNIICSTGICSSTTTTTTTQSPCTTGTECNIVIAMDTSSDKLQQGDFQNEQNIVANYISGAINDFSRVMLMGYDTNVEQIYSFGSMYNKNSFVNNVNTYTQRPGSSLSKLFASLLSVPVPYNEKLSIYIFISEYNANEIQLSQYYAQQLKNRATINFIIIGNDVFPNYLLGLTNSENIFVYTLEDCDINLLVNFFTKNLDCYKESCISPTLPPITTTTQPPCTGRTCNVAIAMDTSSDKLSPYYYQSEQSVLGENIVNILPDISQVALVGYDANVEQFYGPGSITSKTMFSYYVNQYQQNPGSSLSGILKRLTQLPQNGDEKLSTFVFISELNTADSQNVQYYAQILKSRGSLNFVIIGIDVHPSDLYSFTNPQNIFKYEPGDCDIQDLLNFFTSNIICSTGICSSTTTTTTTQSPCTTGTECNIVIAMDTSSDKLQQGDFQNEQNIVANYISGAINDFSRVMLMGYDTNVEQIYSFGSMYNKNSFVNNVNTYTQRPGSSLSKLFASLLSVPVPYNEKLSIYIFISEYNANEIQLSQYYAQQLKSRATINFIIIGNDVFPNYLLGLTNSENIFVYTLEDCDINLLVNFFTKNLDCYKESCISPTLPPITIPFTIPISTTTPKPDCLCYETVHNVQLAIDVSYDKIPTTLFGIQKEILNKISNIIPDFKQFAYLSYAENVQAFNNFNDFTTQYAYNNFVNSLTQTNGSRLSLAMKSLTQTTAPNSGVVTTYVMLSELSITEIEASVEYARILNSRGPINYIIFGDDILPSDIAHLYPTNIFTVTLGECDIDNLIIDIEKTIQSSEVCYNDPKKCQIITTTIKPQCEKKFIFAIDSSTQFLDSDEFNYQKKILSQNVTTQIVSDYKNVALINYDVNPYIDNYFFGNINDWTSFNNDINSITQGGSQLNLDKLLQALTNEQLPEPNLTIFIFISQKLNNLQNSIVNAEKLLSIGTLNFILIGTDIHESDLSGLPYSKAFQWDFTSCPVSNLIQFFEERSQC